ncbi:MAG: NAD(P)/FAD-dependent oxidoreductase [Solirubrobacteraceae bacterium]
MSAPAQGAAAGGVLIVGGGLAAVRTAQALRSLDFSGDVCILAGERELPYDRPPLSKELLTGAVQEAELRLLAEEEYERLGIELELGARAIGIDLDARIAWLATGASVGFAQLVIATGARPRRLAALAELSRVHTLRTLEDTRALRSTLQAGRKLVVVGGGFVGLEAATAAIERGCEVTVIEAASQPLAAVLGERLGQVVGDWHRSHGVRLLCDRAVSGAEEQGASATLTLDDGARLRADVVLCAVGVEPEVEWLAGTPLWTRYGVRCEQDGRTALVGVYAAGDAARPRVGDRHVAIAHWTPAAELARRVAVSIVGGAQDGRDLDDYFWSDQFGARLQLVGSIDPAGELSIEEGAIEDWSFLARCRVRGVLTGVFAMNRPRDFVRARLAMQATAA